MMTSYHALNGIPTSAHPIIQTELRERLGWEGMMMSDGGAISYMLNFKCELQRLHNSRVCRCSHGRLLLRPDLNISMADNMSAASAAALRAGTDLNSGGCKESDAFSICLLSVSLTRRVSLFQTVTRRTGGSTRHTTR